MKMIFPIIVVIIAINISTYGLEVTLNIKGSLEEIMKVIECLKSMGVGEKINIEETEDPLKVHIFSSTSKPEKEYNMEKILGFQEITIEPSLPKPGEKIKISAKVIDNVGDIDTISVNIMGIGIRADLKDDGENGDEVGGDGVWSGILTLPEDVKNRIVLVLTAYDSNGKVIQIKNSDGTLRPIMGISEINIQGE